ncbi:MAG: Rne/Rng family ribonuclease, partial [Zoogloeaceae bacterium]|nr:Rne/Rng family ribonuclease [Zoogloeaceae bacterium]
MKRMLFNATQAEELRVAIVDGQKLIDLDIESASKEERKSNIYKAVITRLEPSLEAAFVDYGSERHGFLPFKEIARSNLTAGNGDGKARPQDGLKVGQELIVQVEKDERGNKGAALTTFISLAGRYLVLMPNNPRGGGVSRRVEGDERTELREIMDQLDVPPGMSMIARTAAIGRSSEELQWDLNYLLQLWQAIEGAAVSQSGAFLIYQEGSLVIRAIRDYFQPDIGEILIDTDDVYAQARQFMEHVMPGNVAKVKRYSDDVPLFSRFQIEHQIESAYSRQVTLPSGGAVVIDHTEALVSVDVNSGRATKGADIEETAFRTNLEAADEIARQLRLRDLGGLIVIDFIDMESQKNQREVENRLRDALRHDRARVQTAKISRFGLLELSRQRLRPALAETSYITCPRCNGTGHIRSTESSALHILRILEEEAMKENTGAVHLQVPVDVATYLLNEKRSDVARVELRHKIQLIIVPNRHLETPHHEIIRLRHDQLNAEDIALASYQMVAAPIEENLRLPSDKADAKPPRAEAMVKGISPDQPAPNIAPKAEQLAAPVIAPLTGIVQRFLGWLFGPKTPALQAKPAETTPAKREARPRNERTERSGERGDGRRPNNRNRREGGRGEDENTSRPQPQNQPSRRTEGTERDGAPAQDRESGQGRNRRGRGEKRGNKPEEALETIAASTLAPLAAVTSPETL